LRWPVLKYCLGKFSEGTEEEQKSMERIDTGGDSHEPMSVLVDIMETIDE
jgi:hypothetical protein